MRPVDKLLAAYFVFLTAVMLARGAPESAGDAWLLAMHALFGLLLFLLLRSPSSRLSQVVHDLYPIALLVPLYAELGVLNEQHGMAAILANDALVQRWEASLFGTQVSYEWMRRHPSVFWSGAFHLAYFSYYPIVVLAPVVLEARRRYAAARSVIQTTMVAFVVCYVCFVLFPVAGPYYAFDHPTGAVRDVWSARLIYGILAGGSSVGAAFPSSHVAATTAATIATWRVWRPAGVAFLLPALVMTVGTVYCQMHYGVDALAGVAVGIGAAIGTAGRRHSGTAAHRT